MDYLFLTEDDKHDTIAKAMHGRESEHYNYELNKINYEHMLEAYKDLPEEWPENLTQYKTIFGDKLAELVHGEIFELVCRYQFRDKLRVLLKTTIVEQNKTTEVYEALKKQLPEDKTEEVVVRILSFFENKKDK